MLVVQSPRRRALLAGMFAVGGVCLGLGVLRAAGPPTGEALFYAGTLEESGVPVEGTRDITLSLWTSATAMDAASKKCESAATGAAVSKGRFRVALSDACVEQVKANPDLFVEVVVGTTALGRRKLGATPYAVEAGRAATSVSATTAGTATEANGDIHPKSVDTVGTIATTGAMIRKIQRVHGNGPNDETDTGKIVSRVLTANKTRADTGLRVVYTDTFRVIGPLKACGWEITVDGDSCSPAMSFALYGGPNPAVENDVHQHSTVVSTCLGLSAGTHKLQVQVGAAGGWGVGNCLTGWPHAYWSIEAEEVY